MADLVAGSDKYISKEAWLSALIERHGAARQEKFSRGRVAICGLGGGWAISG